MAEIGDPVNPGEEPLEVPDPWNWPEPKKEEAPQTAPPVKQPEKVPAGSVGNYDLSYDEMRMYLGGRWITVADWAREPIG